MGTYVNPDNDGFWKTLKTGRYVDKTGLISYINSVLETDDFETCFTRPCRFGKTTSCKMLTEYYYVGANSEDLLAFKDWTTTGVTSATKSPLSSSICTARS